jgi:hypothetical protein
MDDAALERAHIKGQVLGAARTRDLNSRAPL